MSLIRINRRVDATIHGCDGIGGALDDIANAISSGNKLDDIRNHHLERLSDSSEVQSGIITKEEIWAKREIDRINKYYDQFLAEDIENFSPLSKKQYE